MSVPRKPSPFHARPAFLVAGGVTLLGFGAVMGIGFDLVTRPEPSAPVAALSQPIGEEADVSREVTLPKVVLPDAVRDGSILQNQGEARRAWASERTVEPGAEPSGPRAEAPLLAFAVPSQA